MIPHIPITNLLNAFFVTMWYIFWVCVLMMPRVQDPIGFLFSLDLQGVWARLPLCSPDYPRISRTHHVRPRLNIYHYLNFGPQSILLFKLIFTITNFNIKFQSNTNKYFNYLFFVFSYHTIYVDLFCFHLC